MTIFDKRYLFQIKTFVKHIGIMMGLNLLIKPIWILTENFIQNEVGHDTFGLYSALLSLVIILAVFIDFGINHFVTNTLAKDNSKYQETLSIFIGFRITTLVVFPLLCIGIGYLIGYRNEELYFLFFIALAQTLLQFISLFRAKFQASQSFVLDSLASISDRVILILSILVLFLFYTIDIENFIFSRVLAFCAIAIILLVTMIKKYGLIRISFSFKVLKPVLLKTLPFTLMTLLYAFNERIDMLMVERLFSKSEAGLYAGAYRWYDAFMMIIWILTPMFFSKFSTKIVNEHRALVNNGKLILALPIVFIAGIIFSENEFLFFLFQNSTQSEVSEMSAVLSVLTVSYLINGVFVLYGTYLNAAGFVTKVNKLILISVLINTGLNLWLIPKYGAISAAYTTALSTLILSIGYLIMIKKQVKIDFPILARIIVLGILFLGFNLALKSTADLKWFWHVIVSSITFIPLVFLLGLYKSLISALKAK